MRVVHLVNDLHSLTVAAFQLVNDFACAGEPYTDRLVCGTTEENAPVGGEARNGASVASESEASLMSTVNFPSVRIAVCRRQ